MGILHRLENWGDHHHPKWVDIIRIALGIFLVYKGLQFPTLMATTLEDLPNFMSGNYFLLHMLQYYVIAAHLLGGVALILGVYVRIACIIQIPILLGAVILIASTREAWNPFAELPVALLVLGLLCYFLVAGNGTVSISKYLEEGRS